MKKDSFIEDWKNCSPPIRFFFYSIFISAFPWTILVALFAWKVIQFPF